MCNKSLITHLRVEYEDSLYYTLRCAISSIYTVHTIYTRVVGHVLSTANDLASSYCYLAPSCMPRMSERASCAL